MNEPVVLHFIDAAAHPLVVAANDAGRISPTFHYEPGRDTDRLGVAVSCEVEGCGGFRHTDRDLGAAFTGLWVSIEQALTEQGSAEGP